MAAPQIVSITVDPPVIHECETATITIIATETISGDITLKLTVSNELGETTLRDVIVSLAGAGVLTYALTAPVGTVTQHPTQPHIFLYRAPCPTDPAHDPLTHTTDHTH